MLTIDEIKDISFRKGRGYKGEDVDAFIDEVIVTVEQLKKEKSDLIRKMDILATRVEQYRADEETVRNALLSAQRVADSAVKEANAKSAKILAEAEAKAKAMLAEGEAVNAKQKDIYLKLKADSVKLRSELETIYASHLKTVGEFPTDAVLVRKKEELDRLYPTAPVEEEKPVEPVETAEPEETVEPAKVEPPVRADEDFEPVTPDSIDYVKEDSKYSDLKFGDNYDVDAD